MGSLVTAISAISAARYGVNILEQSPPGGVRGSGTNVVAMVADLPWGPVDRVVEITSPGEFFDTFAPLAFGTDALDDYPALKAVLNKTFPNTLKVARISPSAQATATHTFDDAGAGDSVVVSARYPGALGNEITVEFTANATTAGNRDMTVTIGTTYEVTYENVVLADLTVTDPGDPFVTIAAAGAMDAVPAAASSALSTGADGTAAVGDYSAGIDLFAAASVEWHVGFVAECPSALIDTVNDALKTFQDTHAKGIWVLSTPAAQAYATAKTWIVDYRSDRLFYAWPKVKTTNTYDPDRAEVTVDGNAFAAVALASVVPEKSPGGAPGAPFLRGITGLEIEANATQLNDLNANGISPWFMSSALEGAILHNAVLTTLTAGKTKVFRRRMTDFLLSSISAFLERYTGELLDLDLANQALGDVTGPEIGQVRQFLQDLVTTNRLRAYNVDPFGANTQSNVDSGEWRILIEAQLFSAQEKILLLANIGETVQVTEQA